MKFWIIVLVILGAVFYILYPLVNRERQCYMISQADLSRIASNVLNMRISKETSCSESTDTLFTLEGCMQDATKSSMVAPYVNDTIQRIIAITRPYEKNLWTLKADHNLECAQSESYQLP